MDKECPICGELLNTKYVHKLDCNHEFHYECLLKSLKFQKKNICPTCRDPFNYLPVVNGLRKLEYRIHYDSNNKDSVKLNNLKCNHIITKGKNKGNKCNKNCKIGFNTCSLHTK
tara:strand:- start:7226 stop:7567 length:342 start_codon:yes stop_codon:yes gene_type:complete